MFLRNRVTAIAFDRSITQRIPQGGLLWRSALVYSAPLTSADDKLRGFNRWYLSPELARLRKYFPRRFCR